MFNNQYYYLKDCLSLFVCKGGVFFLVIQEGTLYSDSYLYDTIVDYEEFAKYAFNTIYDCYFILAYLKDVSYFCSAI